MLDREACQRARLARDARFDGCFFIAVKTTRIYCRPICPARPPKEENVTYYISAAAAAEAGYRPCLRCRPEASPGTPAWIGAPVTVVRALRLIGEDALEETGVDGLAERLGVGSRQLRRLFVQHVGASPTAVAQTRRAHFAKRLIDETDLAFADIAMTAGFGSIRRFNAAFQQIYGRTPSELRRRVATKPVAARDSFRLRLAFRKPYNWEGISNFFSLRAIPGIETVANEFYRRTIALNGVAGLLEIRPENDFLDVRIDFPDTRMLFGIVERVKRMFDVSADVPRIEEHLSRDPELRRLVERRPGLRIPGAWDPFELTVRAVLGQQISVKGASTLAGRIAGRFGVPFRDRLLFPSRQTLATAAIEECGVTSSRAETIRALAADALWEGTIQSNEFLARLHQLRGIGSWTAQYVAMRALGEPDAFPAGDLVLQRVTGCKNERELEARAEAWRPWRAYAAMHLWQGANDKQGASDK